MAPATATAPQQEPVPPLKTLLYCHDTYGLGHLRRTLSIAEMLGRSPLDGPRLVVTGSPVGHRFPLPPGTDLITLPAVVKVGAGRYEARSLARRMARLLARPLPIRCRGG